MKILLIYSSLTGNTALLANTLSSFWNDQGHTVTLKNLEDGTTLLKSEVQDGDVIALGYWVDKGNANKAVLDLKETLATKSIFLFGTLGANPTSEHAMQCISRVNEHFQPCDILGHFLCQGKINPKLIEGFKALPYDHPHYPTDEKMKRYDMASKHPDAHDLKSLIRCAQESFNALEKEVN